MKKSEDRSGLFVPAGLFLGMGVGFFTDQIVGGIFVGLGLGFLGMAIAKGKDSKKEEPPQQTN